MTPELKAKVLAHASAQSLTLATPPAPPLRSAARTRAKQGAAPVAAAPATPRPCERA